MTDTADAHTDDAAEFPSGPCPVTDLATDYVMFDPD